MAFIGTALVIHVLIGTAPAALLVFVGGFNGLILPIGMVILMYIRWIRRDLLGGCRYPKLLLILGTAAAAEDGGSVHRGRSLMS